MLLVIKKGKQRFLKPLKIFPGDLLDTLSRRVDRKKEKHKEELEKEAHRRRECTKAVGDDSISPDSILYKSCNR